jgi:hypothetical protein
MAIIIPYQSQSGINNAGGGQAAPYRTAAAFTTPGQAAMPGALEHFAGGLNKLNDAVFKMQLDKQRVRNATAMLADETAYRDALRDFDSEYKNTHQGENALTAEQDYNDFHREQFQKLQEKWGGNPHLMQAVASMAEGIRQPSLNKAVAYREQQEEVHKTAVCKVAEDEVVALWADPSAGMQEKQAALTKQIGYLRLLSGQRPETGKDGITRWVGGDEGEVKVKINQLVQTLHGGHVQSLMHADRYAEAEKFTRAHMREFGDRANDMLMLVEARREAWAHKVEREQEKALVSNAYNALAGKTPQEAVAFAASPEGQKAFGLSAKQGEEVTSMLYTNWNRLKTVEAQAKEEHINQTATKAFDLALGSGGVAPDPVAALTLVRESNLDGFAKAKAMNLIETGSLGKTQNPLMAAGLINGIMDETISEADIHLAALTGEIKNETRADLLQFLKARNEGARKLPMPPC